MPSAPHRTCRRALLAARAARAQASALMSVGFPPLQICAKGSPAAADFGSRVRACEARVDVAFFCARNHPGRNPMPKRTDISSILIIGAGPIVIGQACEFDYSGTQACKALRAEGYRVILV